MGLFLQTLVDSDALAEGIAGGTAGGLVAGGLLALIMGMLAIVAVIGVALWIYTSFAFMAIAKKAKYPKPGFAWIPVVGPALITAKTAQMHWWPILLLAGGLIPIASGVFFLAFSVFSLIWLWKTYEAIGKPNWWAILMIIPIVGLIFLGIAAWTKD